MGPLQDRDWHRRRASLLADLSKHDARRARRVRAQDLVLGLTRHIRPAS